MSKTDFVIHCMRIYSNNENIGMNKVAEIFRDSNIINDYLLKYYDVLHTQGPSYLYEAMCEYLENHL